MQIELTEQEKIDSSDWWCAVNWFTSTDTDNKTYIVLRSGKQGSIHGSDSEIEVSSNKQAVNIWTLFHHIQTTPYPTVEWLIAQEALELLKYKVPDVLSRFTLRS